MASNRAGRKPAIQITQADYDKLSLLAEGAIEKNPVVAEELLVELDRARIVAEGKLRSTVVRMGSSLRYSTGENDARDVKLVYPGEADIAAGRISILTPIGAALIGLSEGQSIDWTDRNGRTHRLTVERVGEPVTG